MLTPLRVRLGSFALEAQFRAECLASDKRVAMGLMAVAILFLVATIPATFVLKDSPDALHAVWAIRAVVLGMAIAALVIVARVESPRVYDTVVTWWVGLWFVGIVAENALLPAALTSFVAWDVFLTVAVYAALPLAVSRQAALASILSLGDVAVLWTIKSPDQSFNVLDATFAYAAANIVGVFVSRELHGWRRRAFTALREAITAKTELEAALSEVKTLQGIIPICSFCKNIRTDAGDWQQIEAYVHTHSEAAFSHGVCPSCMRIHYPDVAPGEH